MTLSESLNQMRAFGGGGGYPQPWRFKSAERPAPPTEGETFGWAKKWDDKWDNMPGFRGSGMEMPKGFDPMNNPEHSDWWDEYLFRKGKANPWWMRTEQMDRIDEYERDAENRYIPAMYGGRLGAELDVLGAGRAHSQRMAYDDTVAGGGAGAGAVYRSLIAPEQDRGYFSDAATRVGAVQSGQAQELMGLKASTTAARGEVEQYYDSLKQADIHGQRAASAAKDSAKYAALGGLVGGGLSALGTLGGAAILK